MRNCHPKQQRTTGTQHGGTGELYQFSSIYGHFVLNKYAVVRGGSAQDLQNLTICVP